MADRTDRYFQRLLSDLREIIPELHASVGGSRDCLRGRRCWNRGGNLLAEIKSSNKIPYLIGICLIGLEVGTIYMYKVGWAVNTGYIVHSSLIAVGLLIAGYVLFREPITVNKVIGIVICMIGLYFINK